MNRADFYKSLRSSDCKLFGSKLGSNQVQGIEGILDAFDSHGDGSIKTLAYALATAYHEVGRNMLPVREGFAKTDAGARRAVAALARRRGPGSAVARYSQPQGPYGHVYYGRGHVQLTWMDNYARSSADAGTDLVKNPDAMLEPKVSARVMIRGLIDGRWNGQRKGIAHYLPPDGPDDLRNARRTVNITDKWGKIAGYYSEFLTALKAAGFGKTSATPETERPAPSLPAPQIPPPGGLIGIIIALFQKLFGRKNP